MGTLLWLEKSFWADFALLPTRGGCEHQSPGLSLYRLALPSQGPPEGQQTMFFFFAAEQHIFSRLFGKLCLCCRDTVRNNKAIESFQTFINDTSTYSLLPPCPFSHTHTILCVHFSQVWAEIFISKQHSELLSGNISLGCMLYLISLSKITYGSAYIYSDSPEPIHSPLNIQSGFLLVGNLILLQVQSSPVNHQSCL